MTDEMKKELYKKQYRRLMKELREGAIDDEGRLLLWFLLRKGVDEW